MKYIFTLTAVFYLSLIMLAMAAENVTDTTKGTVNKQISTATDLVKGQVRTRYDISGRPINQSVDSKGLHWVVGTTILSSGVDTLDINTSTSNGKQDISYIDSTTYLGKVWSRNLANRSKVYRVIPISGTKFTIVSSDATDTSYVHYVLEGE